MLLKRTRSNLKDPQMVQLSGDTISESKFYSFFNVPIFVGLTSKTLESDSAKSPTSPLDFRVFSNLGNPFWSPRSSNNEHRKTWFRNKVGLGIVDSPDFETDHSGKILRASDSKNIIFGIKTLNSSSQCSIEAQAQAPKSLPSNRNSFADSFELDSSVKVRSFSFDSERSRSFSKDTSFLDYKSCVSENGSSDHLTIQKGPNKPVIESIPLSNNLINNIQPSEIELSEDYTCVRVHGPNPKVTHIFGDCILSCHDNDSTNFGKNKEDKISMVPSYHPPCDFLSFCYKCNKNLDGEDIYMYRGEKAFCSTNCRLQEILIDEETEEKRNNNNDNNNNNNESFESSWFIST